MISENIVGIYLVSSSRDNTAQHNTISNNTEYGIIVESPADHSIKAAYNDWGHPSGPYHPTKNPWGEGNKVSDKVEFEPWLGKEEEPDDDGGFLPGFGAVLLPVALATALLLPRRRRVRTAQEQGWL